MSDYTACENSACHLRGGCYRYLLIWSELRQSVAWFEPTGTTDKCDHLLPVEHRDRVESLAFADKRNKQVSTKPTIPVVSMKKEGREKNGL